MQIRKPQDLLLVELREIHNAEKQLSRAVPRLMKSVRTDSLRRMLEQRVERGGRLIEEIESALEEMELSVGRRKNEAAAGLIDDMNGMAEDIQEPELLEAALIGGVQKVEHYCIAAWGTARAFAKAMGVDTVVKAMDRALKEGAQFDEELTRIAEKEVNPAAVRAEEAGGSERRGDRKGGEARA